MNLPYNRYALVRNNDRIKLINKIDNNHRCVISTELENRTSPCSGSQPSPRNTSMSGRRDTHPKRKPCLAPDNHHTTNPITTLITVLAITRKYVLVTKTPMLRRNIITQLGTTVVKGNRIETNREKEKGKERGKDNVSIRTQLCTKFTYSDTISL